MAEENNRDYWAAFAIGAVVGIGATLLLAPSSGARDLLYEIEPALKRARKGTRRARKEARGAAKKFGRRGGRALRVIRKFR